MQKLLYKLSLTLILLQIPVALFGEVIVDVAYQNTFFDYREYDMSGTILDSEKAKDLQGYKMRLKGKYANGIFAKSTASYIELSYDHSAGETEYVGAYLSGGSYGSVVSTTNNTIDKYSFMLMEEYSNSDYSLYVGVGAGHREWERELSRYQSETYKWFFMSAQIGTRVYLNKEFSFGLSVQYNKAINPKMDATTTGYPFMSFDLGGVKGYEIALPIAYRVNKNLELYSQYEREYFKIAYSNVVNGFYEPDSTTKNNKVSVGLRLILD